MVRLAIGHTIARISSCPCLGVSVVKKQFNMPKFNYTAVDARGADRSGCVEANDVRQVIAILRGQGLFPTDITIAGSSVVREGATLSSGRPSWWPRNPWARLMRPVSVKELALFTRQLITLVRAGMPLLRGLELLERQERNVTFRRIIGELAGAIRAGGTLSAAMAAHPRVFDRLYLNLVRAGEAGGMLDDVLERLARFQEKSQRLRRQIRTALAYPLVVLLVAAAILAGLMVFVVPRFRQIFADLLKGAPLPPLTQAVLSASDVVTAHYAAVLLAGVAGWLITGWWFRSPRGARWRDRWVLRLPLFGGLLRQSVLARFARTLGTLLAGGVPILPALLITRDACGNRFVAAACDAVHDRVKQGAPLARSLEGGRVFPPLTSSMVEVGEQTGQLPGMLGRIADLYEDEVDQAVAGLSSLLEPLLILALALMVGTIVIALFLPIVRIVQLMS